VTKLRIGLVGDFDREKRSHWATEAALFHAAARLGILLEPRWLSTSSLAEEGAARGLYIPYLGTCVRSASPDHRRLSASVRERCAGTLACTAQTYQHD
jgi:CTP synthase (UTP-ammonia lyase)